MEIEISTMSILEFIMLISIAIIGFTGNAVIIFLFAYGGSRVRILRNFLIVSLSFADLVIAGILVPFWIALRRATWRFYTAFDVMFGTASILNLTAISLERLHAIKSPLRHLTLTETPYFVAIIVSWTIGTALFFVKYLYDLHRPNMDTYFLVFTLLLFITVYLIPILIIILAYTFIFYYANYKKKHVRQSSILERKNFKRELKAAKTIALVVGLFILCWTPFFVVNLIYIFIYLRYKKHTLSHLEDWFYASKVLHYGNSIMNVIIYGFRSRDFRRLIRFIINKLTKKNNNV
ncbi:D(1C) dopamine receptor isoform X1 [Hydra vulgaris]|uniref:D(1C) dopamine receptor isoform X1 n=1 Tax=Hydra vulgaris TaxID=6087 RepID=UPI0032EA4759